MKKQKNFKLEEKTLADLQEYAERNSMTQTEVVEEAIRAYIRELYASYTPDSEGSRPGNAFEVEALVKQLDVKDKQLDVKDKQLDAKDKQLDAKDKQIEALSNALVSAQETAKAAQVLHAADKPELALESVEQKKSRWARLRDAWRG